MNKTNKPADAQDNPDTETASPEAETPLLVMEMYVNRVTSESVKLFAIPDNAELLIDTASGAGISLRDVLTEGARIELRLFPLTPTEVAEL